MPGKRFVDPRGSQTSVVDQIARAHSFKLGRDLVATFGQRILGYLQQGVSATVLATAFTAHAEGGTLYIPAGVLDLATTATFSGTRLHLEGDGENSTILRYNNVAGGVCLAYTRASPNQAAGVEQCSVKNMSFLSTASAAKTAIQFNNIANGTISGIGIAGASAWPGDSIGIECTGRQFVNIVDNDIACARPLVFNTNVQVPSLTSDYFFIAHNNLTGTSATRPVIEFTSGTSFSNTAINGCSLAGGKNGIEWNDTTSGTTSFNLSIINCRTEQGLDAAGYGLYLASTAQSLQNLYVRDCQFGADRNGVFLRNCFNATFVNCKFNQSGKTAVNITLVPNSSLHFINCAGEGTFTITNGLCVSRSSDNRSGGFTELWVYNAMSSSGAQLSSAAHGGEPIVLTDTLVSPICDDTYCGFVRISTSQDSGAVFFLRGGTHSAEEIIDVDGQFSKTKDTASSLNVYWDVGTARYVIQNLRGTTVTVAPELGGGIVNF